MIIIMIIFYIIIHLYIKNIIYIYIIILYRYTIIYILYKLYIYIYCATTGSGAIEVATNSSKTARRVHNVVGDDDSDVDADEAFESIQKKLRVSASTNAETSEIALKAPKVEDDEDEEFAMLLWGDAMVGSSKAGDKVAEGDGHGEKEPSLKRRPAGKAKARAASSKVAENPDDKAEPSDNQILLGRGTSKKIAAEARELDKGEALVLSAKQLSLQLGDPRQLMNVTLPKINHIIEKVDARLADESTKVFLEIIKREGSQCRAADLWQSLKNTRELLSGIMEFVEALQDQEAAPDTLSSRSQRVRELGVHLPASISTIICRRSAGELVNAGKLKELFGFLNLEERQNYPAGIGSIIPADGNAEDEKVADMIREFQSTCVTHSLHSL